MMPRTVFLVSWYGSAVAWDLVCPRKQTVSHAIAALLANKWTRWPVIILLGSTVTHLFALARNTEEMKSCMK